MKLPPPVTGASRDRLLQAFDRLASFEHAVLRRYPDELTCNHGCDDCCRQVLRLRGVEAAFLLEGARELLPKAVSLVWKSLAAPEATACPLLQGGVCLVYEHRPAICRTHGLPLLRREPGGAVLHHCPKNFRSVDAPRIPTSLLLDEERLCLMMDGVDALYAQETRWGGDRIPVDELLRRGLQP